MTDFRGQFFSYQRQEPEILPERIRLKDKTTRYAYSVTIEELNSVGYEGPVTVPSYGTDQYLVWDPESLTYSVFDGVDPIKGRHVCSPENSKARALLTSRITNSISSSNEDGLYTDKFIKEHSVYKGKLLDLYFKTNCCELTCEDIPSPPTPSRAFKSEQNKYLNTLASGQIGIYKTQYEGFGVIPDIHPDLADFLPLPYPDWVKGSGLLDVEVILSSPNGPEIVKPSFGRHCFS